MKLHTLSTIVLVCSIVQVGCQSSNSKSFQTSEGIAEVVTQLNTAFGKGAYYTDITISYDKTIGTTISATGTQNPLDKKLIRKVHASNEWDDVSEVTLEVSGGAQASDFMFTLNVVDELKTVPLMVSEAINKIKHDKQFDVVAEHVNVAFPSRRMGPDDAVTFSVNLKPANGGTSFIVVFDAAGKYQRMIY